MFTRRAIGRFSYSISISISHSIVIKTNIDFDQGLLIEVSGQRAARVIDFLSNTHAIGLCEVKY